MHCYSEILKNYINIFARKINLWFYAIAVKTLKQLLKELKVNTSKFREWDRQSHTKHMGLIK